MARLSLSVVGEQRPTPLASPPGKRGDPPRPSVPLWERRHRPNKLPTLLPESQCRLGGQAAAAPTTRQVEEEFDVLGMLGRGGTSTVTSARRRSDGRQVALKNIRSGEQALIKMAEQEYNLLLQLDHPNIIQALDFFTPLSTHAVLVLELCPGKTLEDAVRSRQDSRLPEEVARSLCGDLVQAVEYLHRRGVVHRDIKPQNAMVTDDLRELCLVDFNVACNQEDGLLTPTGTKSCAAPEVCNGGSSSQASDVWGVGVCLHFMVTGQLPLRWAGWPKCSLGTSPGEERDAGLDPEVRFLTVLGVTSACKSLVRECLHFREVDRPTASQVANMPWLKEVRKHEGEGAQ